MNQEKLKSFFSNSISFKLLGSDNRDFIMAFLYKMYGDAMEISIDENDITEQLSYFIESFGEVLNPYKSKKAEEWLNDWCDIRNQERFELGGYLEKHRASYGYGYVFSLSPQTVSVLRWVKELLDYEDGKFIATDSRFSDIFSKLGDMIEQSIDNKDDKLAQLKEQKRKIENEILDIETGHYDFERLGTEAFQERFDETTQMAKNLLGDFRQAERNIKEVLNELYKQKLDVETNSGKLVAFVLEANEKWRFTAQGRSFDAFYNFLKNPKKQEEFKSLIKQVYKKLLQENPDLFLEEIVGRLGEQAYTVQRRIQLVMEELERSLAERHNIEEKYTGQLITEIKKMAMSIAETPPKEKDFLYVQDFPDFIFLLDRGVTVDITETKKPNRYNFDFAEATDNNELIKEQFAGMNPLEKERIQQRIDTILKIKSRITFIDLVIQFPIENGLSELMAYIEIATQNEQHFINRDESQEVLVTKMPDFQRIISVPQIIFRQ
jgi:hypothetical protein